MFEIGPENESLQHNDDPGRQYHLSHMEQQKEMLKGHRDEIIIAVALASMPNIRRVTLPNHWCPARDLLGTSYFSPWRPKLPRGEPSGLPLQSGRQEHCRTNIDYGFKVLYRAMKLARPSIQELSVDYYDDLCRSERLLTRGIFPRSLLFSPRDLEDCCTAFSQLRKIPFSLCPASTDDEWDILMEGNLAAVDRYTSKQENNQHILEETDCVQ
ncbi:uncharacterized protein G6M90_00g069410 [Metarhizium brunneum]|uniref:Uncharacterized protein n=1 Tax=Metarhizium brunneum TaxID=500148 RepID=A0A7D5Z3Z7_9HYPO|nr:hypothetical protein G6M90_00g069410 [Metarhizium brunneum]